jgi:formylglycine-generating enzyme required for sulfatase activity
VDLGKGIKLEMVLIPAGKFMMGSPASEKGRGDNEKQHEVTLTKPFYMGKYEVTQEQWEAVMGNNPSVRTKGARLPVTDVWGDYCQEFIKKLNAKTDGGYRLPTEAEWEYACRAGTTTAYSFGDEIAPKDANYAGSRLGKSVVVGSYKPNTFGLYDMHGNVREWCEDWFGPYPTGSVTDPKGPATGERWALRGGCFVNDKSQVRSSDRNNYNLHEEKSHGPYGGFRLARTADAKAAVVQPVPNTRPAEIIPALGNLLLAPFTEAKAKEAQKASAKSLLKEVEEKEDLGKGIKLDLVLIPAGKFMMGSPVTEQGRSPDEKQHEVTLTKPFYMGKYEVTQEQYEAVMGNNPSSRTKGAKLPVTDVSWDDCQEFIKKLNAKTNGSYRLPSEAEWEYACRAGTSTVYSFGNNLTKNEANVKDSSAKLVGSYKPNAFGLYDMHGNVCEWCEDWKADYLEGSVTDPKGPGKGGRRVLRGGSFWWEGSRRSFSRSDFPSASRNFDFGFRLARTVDMKAAVVPAVPKSDPAAIMSATGNLLVAPFNEAKAKEVQKSVAKSLQKEAEETEDLGKGVKLEMVLIPAGKFMMGSPASEKGRRDNETQHEVTLTKPFYMGKYEVTQEQWESVMGDNPSSAKGAKLPVTGVSWKDCQGFIEKLNAKTSGGYRRPTEAEWEYSCRAGTTTAYSFGDVLTKSDAYYNESGGRIKEVGSYKPNAFGFYDMHGNVWEWCEDSYGDYPEGAVIDPKGPATGGSRVLRGGSFLFDVSFARSSSRYGNSPTARNLYNGFRLARTP